MSSGSGDGSMAVSQPPPVLVPLPLSHLPVFTKFGKKGGAAKGAKGGPLPTTPRCKSGNIGSHYYVSCFFQTTQARLVVHLYTCMRNEPGFALGEAAIISSCWILDLLSSMG
jgi:hypothetical protein